MVKKVNKLLILDLLVLLVGMIILWIRPFGLDITWGILVVSIGFLFSIILFCVKFKIASKNK